MSGSLSSWRRTFWRGCFLAPVQGNPVAWVMEMGATLPDSVPFLGHRGWWLALAVAALFLELPKSEWF